MTTIVMTGGTSGLGRYCARRLSATPGVRLLLGARNAPRDAPSDARVVVLPLDLASLDSVRGFAAQVCDGLGSTGIGGLVLNAGLSRPDADGRTRDGFETTFAVNHLGHYLLLRLLRPRLSPGATVVLTTSGTHDPANGTIIPPPRHANATLLGHPDRDPNRDPAPLTAGGRAYASSKLCNVLTARSLATRAPELAVIAYDPGPTPGTRLTREAPLVVRLGWRVLGTRLGRLVPRLSSRQAAGDTLAELTLGNLRPPAGHCYAALRRGALVWPELSELASQDDVMDALWADSAALIGCAA